MTSIQPRQITGGGTEGQTASPWEAPVRVISFEPSRENPMSDSHTAVERYFFSPLYTPRNRWAVLGWWERRRIFYNISVGIAGLVTIASGYFLAALPPHPGHFSPVWMLVPLYGLMANIFYSFGAPVDLLLRRYLGQSGAPVAQAIFRYGYAFAIGLTLLPIPLMVMGWILKWFIR